MKLTQFMALSQNIKGGTFKRVMYQTQQKCYKDHEGEVVKITTGIYRLKCAYGNLNWVKARDTESTEVKPQTVVNWVVKNLVELTEKGHLIWMYTDKHHRPVSTYYYKGNPVSKQWLIDNHICSESMLKGSYNENQPKNHPIKKYVEDIIQIGA